MRCRLRAIGLSMLAVYLAGCGGGGGGGESGPFGPTGPGVVIESPATDPASQICNAELLAGSAGFGTGANCCTGTAEQLTGVRVTWANTTTGASGQAVQNVTVCPIFFLCNHTWSAAVPLALGDNRITVTASDTRTGAASTDTITINKPIPTYAVSGTFSSHLGVPLPGAGSTSVTRVGADGSHSAGIASGAYGMSCVPDGTYTLTPSSTINYDFSPPSRSVTVAGADVSGQDFTATAFVISGGVTFASNGAGVASQAISLSGSASVAAALTDSGGLYRFLVPNGTYTLTVVDALGVPEPTSPPSRTVTVNNADVPAQDFVR